MKCLWENEYDGSHTVDIAGIFPNFDVDPYDPDSYFLKQISIRK